MCQLGSYKTQNTSASLLRSYRMELDKKKVIASLLSEPASNTSRGVQDEKKTKHIYTQNSFTVEFSSLLSELLTLCFVDLLTKLFSKPIDKTKPGNGQKLRPLQFFFIQHCAMCKWCQLAKPAAKRLQQQPIMQYFHWLQTAWLHFVQKTITLYLWQNQLGEYFFTCLCPLRHMRSVRNYTISVSVERATPIPHSLKITRHARCDLILSLQNTTQSNRFSTGNEFLSCLQKAKKVFLHVGEL